ncbi:MAG TPA: DUF3261 domain-containing protein [Smithellaceae bacterium]|nr:DUF3261 domain-containing protein [Smithellaceae bacterium]HRS90144.1 DUF3261 domain-containing protein [Smithellaceae bacterium]HRV26961.1 DUF3261 domain-containing protein [Smithellaceae bacterium]
MKLAPLIILFLFVAGCQTLPVIKEPLPSEKTSLACPFPFLHKPATLIHAIEARMAGSAKSAVIGITSANPATRELSCAIMTAEGMVLFEAKESAGTLHVSRALPPFDAPAFAQNMINDIKLIFFSPEGNLQKAGFLPTGDAVCRWRSQNAAIIDVREDGNDKVEILRYSSCGKLKRQIKFSNLANNYYQNIELHARELANYSLLMNLIEVQSLPATNKNRTGKK